MYDNFKLKKPFGLLGLYKVNQRCKSLQDLYFRNDCAIISLV